MLHGSRFILHPSALILILALCLTSYDYFVRWVNAPEARYIYGADIAEAAGYVNATRDEGLVAISAEYYRDLDPFRFTLHSHGEPPFVIWFDGRQSLAFPPPESGLSPRYIFPASAPPAEIWQSFLQASPAESGRDYKLYRLPAINKLRQAEAATFSPQNQLGVTVNDDLVVSACQILGSVISGGKFQVVLSWQALRALPPDADYTFLVQLRDNQEHVWAEADGNGYPAGDWQPGIQGLQLLVLRLPGDLPPRLYHLTAQVVDRRTGQALPTATGETSIFLTSLSGQLAKTPRLIDPESLPNPIPLDPDEGSGPEIVLRGYDIASDSVQHGQTLDLTLHWQVLQAPSQNYDLEFFLTNDQTETIYHWPTLKPINGEWPTRQWPAEYWVQDRLSLPMETDVPFGHFTLRVAWVNEAGEPVTNGFDLGQVTITQ